MGRILGNWRITLASLFAVVLVVGAYLFARSVESPSFAQASTETELLHAIAAKDSDGDGLVDWAELLHGTDPHVVDTHSLGMTDGEAVTAGLIVPKAVADIPVAVPSQQTGDFIDYAAAGLTPPDEGLFTDAFAKNFFLLYLAAKESNNGNALSSTQTNALVEQSMLLISKSVAPARDFKRAVDLKVGGSGQDALRAFAVSAEAIFNKNTSSATMNETLYLQSAVVDDDPTALARLTSIATAYRNSAFGLAALTVPQELKRDNLALINALMRISEIIEKFSHVDSDPISAMIALQQYVPAARALGEAFTSISDTYAAAGILLPTGAPGASFVNVIADLAVRQAAEAKRYE